MNFQFSIFNFQSKRGTLLIHVLVFGSIASVLISAVITWAGNSMKEGRVVSQREQAFYIAESGLEYYRWHLAHSALDFKDGTATSGPYIHPYYDTSGNMTGQFSLSITPPPSGSTIVTLVSTGTYGSTTISRSIEARLAIPSLSKYAFVANDVMRFGEGTEVFGPIHSNEGIRFDGLVHNTVTSAKSSYDDPDHSGAVEFGVHTHVNAPPSSGVNNAFRAAEAPPSVVPSRVDVFEVGRTFPVPAVDFTGFTSDMATMKTLAQSASGKYFAPSGASGYHIVLKTNDTFDIYKVNTLRSPPGSCSNTAGQTEWGTWSVNTQTLLANYAIPANGMIFAEDDVWVDGQINTARVTIAAGKFPESSDTKDITVNNDIVYTNYDGQDVVALVAQGNVNVGLYSDNDLRIDATLLAKNGRVGRYYYSSSCGSNYQRNSLTLYGSLGSNQRYGFAYTDGTGYDTRIITYDANLLYGPPPNFPLASDQYQVISWREI